MILNPEQEQAVNCDENCLIVACPGSGKTRLLVEKTARILRRNPLAKIILVSFTRDSVTELRVRISKEIQNTVPKNCVISTFHSLALQQIRRSLTHGQVLPKLITGEIQNYYLRQAFNKFNRNEYEFETAVSLIENARGSLDYLPETDSTIGKMVHEYNNLLKKNKMMDMTDILIRVVNGLFDGSILPFAADYICIDEFQDSDETQLQWLLCHHAIGCKLTAVGDDDQSIYGFRRSLGYEGMKRFAAETNAKIIYLGTNYRCRSEILAAGESIIISNRNRLAKKLVAEKGCGGVLKTQAFNTSLIEADELAKDILATASDFSISYYDYGTFAILVRNNYQLDEIERALCAVGIPYFRASKSFWEAYPVCHTIDFLSYLSKENTKSDVEIFISWLVNDNKDMEYLRNGLGQKFKSALSGQIEPDLRGVSPNTARKIISLQALVKECRQHQDDFEGATATLSAVKTWLETYMDHKSYLEMVNAAVKSITESYKGSLSDRLKTIKLSTLANTKKNEERVGVFLTTMHGSKGLEFNHVWVAGVNSGVIPAEKQTAPKRDAGFAPEPPAITKVDYEEERRLLYVAATRAKETLTITCSGNPSSFFRELEARVAYRSV